MIAALHGARIDYGRGPVLGPLDLNLKAGEIVALVGPSGSGKSTALRLLSGLETPSAGRVERGLKPGETAMVFQSPTLAPWLSALANVALPLELAGVPAASAREQAKAALARVGLAGSEAARPAQLSGGMAMRVSLARALITRPRLLLLDEPFAALDEITRRTLADDLLGVCAELKPATVFVTHSVEEAAYMADRVLVLSAGPGRVVGEAPIRQPIPRPGGYRASPSFRSAMEVISGLLAKGMAA